MFVVVWFASTHALSSKSTPCVTSGKLSAYFQPSRAGATIPVLLELPLGLDIVKLPTNVSADEAPLSGKSATPFQVTVSTDSGAITLSVTLAFRSPLKSNVLPSADIDAFQTR